MTSQPSNAPSDDECFERRVLWLVAFGLCSLGLAFSLPYVGQDSSYHSFADDREALGIANCLNVISNLPFVVIGGLGWLFLIRAKDAHPDHPFTSPGERIAYFVLFGGVFLTGFGSAYYHLFPDNERLVWDRLPMAVAFMAFFAAMIGERISLRAGRILLLPLLLFGVGGVLNWHWSERAGAGNLAIYAVVQFFPLLAIPWMTWLFPARYTGTVAIWQTLGWYVLAKVFELSAVDHGIYSLGHIVSGHTLKHLAAALGAYLILRMLQQRKAIVS